LKLELSAKKTTGWSAAILFSLILNVGLFSLMPGLMKGIEDVKKDAPEPFHSINVVRMRHPEPPVKEKPDEKPEPQKEEQERLIKRDRLKPKITHKLKLPFEINTRLPEAPGIVPTLVMEKYALYGKDIYEMADIDKPITPLTIKDPIYPERAKRLGIEGWVNLKVVVSEEGYVEDAKVVASEPEGVFDKSTLKAAYSWRFTPGTIDGVPVKTHWTRKFSFVLKNENE